MTTHDATAPPVVQYGASQVPQKRPDRASSFPGFVHSWLVAGPRAQAFDPAHFTGSDIRPAVAQAHCTTPTLQGTIQEFASPWPDQPTNRWRRVEPGADRFVDVTSFYATPHFVECWAYTAVECSQAWQGSARLTTHGPADVWVDGRHRHHSTHFADPRPQTVSFPLTLKAGLQHVLVRFVTVARRAAPMVMALEFHPHPEFTLNLPQDPRWRPEESQTLLDAFNGAFMDRETFERHDAITVHWRESQPLEVNITARLERKDGRIYSEQRTEGRTMTSVRLGPTYQFPGDAYFIRLLPDLEEFYRHGRRLERRFPIHLAGNLDYSTARYGTYAQRRREALAHATLQENVFAEIAKMELGQWPAVKWDVLHECIAMIESRADCSDFYLTGLLGALYRYGEQAEFPTAVKEALETCILGFRYWMDEPGQDIMCFWTENHQILFHCCEVLAGQLFPDRIFPNHNLTGAEHQARGEARALQWLRKRARGGFREWDSNTYFEEDVLALTHLADLAESDELHEMAVVVLDKLFFGLAVNSFQGVFGSTHGRGYAPTLKNAHREATSGLARMLWGMGIFNGHVRGTVSLACAESYRLPPVIEALALDPAPEIWVRERHAGVLEEAWDCEEGAWQVNKVTYKTPDYMLASAQDHNPGQPGRQEHIWQATLSPTAAVFVTHPPCLSEDSALRPNAWHGHAILPRVAQYRDVLFALHNLPDDDWMGFTHAYFPTYAFDRYFMQDGWAFAQVGEGYLALTASTGHQLEIYENNARRELRAPGSAVWVLQMGRRALDGEFQDFRNRVRALDLAFDGLRVDFRSLRGDRFEFAWTGPFLRNGAPEPLADFPHSDSPYSQTALDAETMDIQFQDLLLRLHLQ